MKRSLILCVTTLMFSMEVSAQEVPAWFATPAKGEYVGVSLPMNDDALAEKSAEFTAVLSYILSVRKEEVKSEKTEPPKDKVVTEFDKFYSAYQDVTSGSHKYQMFSMDRSSNSSIGSIELNYIGRQTDDEMGVNGQVTSKVYSAAEGTLTFSLDESFLVTKREKDHFGNIWIAIKPNKEKGERKHYEGKCRYIHDSALNTSDAADNFVKKYLAFEFVQKNTQGENKMLCEFENDNDSAHIRLNLHSSSSLKSGWYSDSFKKNNLDKRHLQTFLRKELQDVGYNAFGISGISQFFKSKSAAYTASVINMLETFITDEGRGTYLNGMNNVANYFASGFAQCYFMPQVVEDKPKYAVKVEEKEMNHTFVVAIGNEVYQQVEGVPFAHNDVNAFAEYCQRTLNIPEKQIYVYENATYGTMRMAMRRLKEVSKAFNGDMKIVFYYAGHGIPDEEQNNAYLLPTDADGTMPEVCYSLNQLYSELGGMEAKQVVVFLDACFSGSKRDDGMLQSARGVAIKSKEATLRGNMVVFSAASGEQTAYPYKSKEHGLFTYYLLSKLQKDKGDMSLGELADYIKSEVSRTSIVENKKVQTPKISISPNLTNHWKTMKLK